MIGNKRCSVRIRSKKSVKPPNLSNCASPSKIWRNAPQPNSKSSAKWPKEASVMWRPWAEPSFTLLISMSNQKCMIWKCWLWFQTLMWKKNISSAKSVSTQGLLAMCYSHLNVEATFWQVWVIGLSWWKSILLRKNYLKLQKESTGCKEPKKWEWNMSNSMNANKKAMCRWIQWISFKLQPHARTWQQKQRKLPTKRKLDPKQINKINYSYIILVFCDFALLLSSRVLPIKLTYLVSISYIYKVKLKKDLPKTHSSSKINDILVIRVFFSHNMRPFPLFKELSNSSWVFLGITTIG